MEFKGTSISEQIAIGKLYCHKPIELLPSEVNSSSDNALDQFEQARMQLLSTISTMLEADSSLDETAHTLLSSQEMMLMDPELIDAITDQISTHNLSAVQAVSEVCNQFKQQLLLMDDDYFRARAEDIDDIRLQLLSNLTRYDATALSFTDPVIVVADTLSPSEFIRMNKNNILGFVFRNLSSKSHTAILAKAAGIPALFGIDWEENFHNQIGILDGLHETLQVNPSVEQFEMYQKILEEIRHNEKELSQLKNLSVFTASGKEVHIFSNINHCGELDSVLSSGADGIGLFRTEFLFLNRPQAPSEEEQFQSYRKVIEAMHGQKVIIRTMDIGADKSVDFLDLPKEENPALGYRGIRICLDYPTLFQTQLRAICRASAFGNVAIMFPMITSVSEVLSAKRLLQEVKDDLSSFGINHYISEVGIMVETPAAVMLSDALAKEVDFFSIGTNDLTQYTLAADRQNPLVDSVYQQATSSILKMIAYTIENAHSNHCSVGICGELASDLTLTKELIDLGIDELSVSPSRVLSVKQKIMELNR